MHGKIRSFKGLDLEDLTYKALAVLKSDITRGKVTLMESEGEPFPIDIWSSEDEVYEMVHSVTDKHPEIFGEWK